ncbi:GNAT family N-acetyltransferase [Actinokineospora sp. PR83]|uniref:GNAT family N-acetyltransferase n=1 Tax=Actinokineospora sp. PR83 TaxID=2884908 RepID=UPI001F19A739|nr:GNAT family N-acetyltransferase [Actinokineospora sp. PR83]MCG8920370.1 GNAT family N-acetyltransferase [Actinokineospora sp. PR83]
MRADVLDPRTDPEPAYWDDLRAQAGLRGDWAWPVLAVQAWGARTPQTVTVLFDGTEPVAAVNAGWLGLPAGRFSFARAGARPRLGALHVRGPGSAAVPGWWLAEHVPLAEFADAYARAMRGALGPGALGVVWRQVRPDQVDHIKRGVGKALTTEPLWTIHTGRWTDREQWLMALSRSRRSNLRGIVKRMTADENLEVRVQTGTVLDDRPVAEVMRWNDAKYGGALIPRVRVLGGYLRELSAQPDVRSYSYLDRSTGRLLAFGHVLDHPERPVVRSWSQLPRDRGGIRDLYFHHLASVVGWAIDEGRLGLELGKGKSREKESLGAEPTEQVALAVPTRWW